MFTLLFAVPHLALYPNKLLPRAFNINCASLERLLPQSISETCLHCTADSAAHCQTQESGLNKNQFNLFVQFVQFSPILKMFFSEEKKVFWWNLPRHFKKPDRQFKDFWEKYSPLASILHREPSRACCVLVETESLTPITVVRRRTR